MNIDKNVITSENLTDENIRDSVKNTTTDQHSEEKVKKEDDATTIWVY